MSQLKDKDGYVTKDKDEYVAKDKDAGVTSYTCVLKHGNVPITEKKWNRYHKMSKKNSQMSQNGHMLQMTQMSQITQTPRAVSRVISDISAPAWYPIL